jgi:predicted porin
LNVAAAYGKAKGPGNAGWARLNVGASYRVGKATLMAQFNRGSADENVGNGQRITHYLLGGVFPVGKGGFKFSYVKSDGNGGTVVSIARRDATHISGGYYYDLSRRTSVYAHISRLDNKGSATYVLPGGAAGIRGGENSTGMEFGVRHNF